METRQHTKISPIPEARCPHILFEELGGIYWLRGANLARAKKLLQLSADQKDVGFDVQTAKIYIDDLAEQGVTVGIIRGNTMRTIARQQPTKERKLERRTVWLAPTLLFDETELSRLKQHLNGSSSVVRDLVGTMQTQIGGCDVIREFGTLYVYQVAEDLYEIDWELTTVCKATVESLALIAHQMVSTAVLRASCAQAKENAWRPAADKKNKCPDISICGQ